MDKTKRVFITGGSKGIGYGVAEALLAEGYQVAITGRTQSSLDKALESLSEKYGDKVLAIVSDVRSLEAEKDAIGQVINKWG